jgi:hypothetical protein
MARMFNSSYISGGCLPSLWNHELVNDWDFYFADKRAIELLVKYYTGPGIDDVVTFDSTYGKNKGIPIHEPLITNNAITIKNPLGSTIQLVIKYPNTSIKKITADFDYLHTTWYWSAKENQIWISRNILNSIEEKRLIINNQDNWNNKREEKFQGRGWLESDWRTRPPVSSSFITTWVNNVNPTSLPVGAIT